MSVGKIHIRDKVVSFIKANILMDWIQHTDDSLRLIFSLMMKVGESKGFDTNECKLGKHEALSPLECTGSDTFD